MGKVEQNASDYIVPLNMNGLQGRVLHMPAPKGHSNREILFIYGHHSSLERWFGIAQNLNKYAATTMPDLPGFGGMDSFYKIGEPASLDNFADYMASFIKMRYKRRKVIVVGMSLGFAVATRMLQRYPELTSRVEMLVSVAGFAHRDDFTFTPRRMMFYRAATALFSQRPMAFLCRHLLLNSYMIRAAYRHTHNAKKKFAGLSPADVQRMLDVEVKLWQENEVRTYMRTASEFLNVDNCKVRVDLPVYHVAVAGDNFFDNRIVEQHFRVIFSDYHLLDTVKLSTHAPSIIADSKAAAPFIPPKLRRLLAKR